MDLKIQFDAAAVLQAMDRAPNVTAEEIRRGLLESCRLIQQGAREKHRFRAKTGMLERAIDYHVDRSKCEGVIEINPAVAPYGKYVHEPTGLYGPKHKKYPITPKNKKSLRWATAIGGSAPLTAGTYKNMQNGKFRSGSTFAFARTVMHPGHPADQFLYEAAERSRIEINAIFARHIDKATKEAGF